MLITMLVMILICVIFICVVFICVVFICVIIICVIIMSFMTVIIAMERDAISTSRTILRNSYITPVTRLRYSKTPRRVHIVRVCQRRRLFVMMLFFVMMFFVVMMFFFVMMLLFVMVLFIVVFHCTFRHLVITQLCVPVRSSYVKTTHAALE